MGSNKNVADMAIEAATNKFLAKDYVGAKRFALTAKSLNPKIVGVTQMVATFSMHLDAQHTINGERDHYGVFGVNPQANDETVRKRYEKLVAVFHPDSNKSIGAEEAFKFVSEAWDVLSDKAKRAEYDSKRRNSGSSEGRGASSSSVKKAAAKRKTPKRGPKRASGGAVYTETQTDPHGSQLAVHSESTKRAAASPSLNPPPKRRNVVVEAGSNVASSSYAPPSPPNSNSMSEFSKEEPRNALLRKSKPTIVTNLHDLMTVDVPQTEDIITSGIDKDLGALTINVPYPDFRDFGKDRTEKSFSDEEIWAAYDYPQRMPRVYFMIDKVLSVDPFKLCITKLTTSEPMSSNQLGLGVLRTCGVFRADDSQICKSPSIFSHKVKVVKGDHGEFKIYPRKGEVWALYKNWSHEVVEVIEGYTEEYGVTVFPLMKAAGYTSVFRRHPDPGAFRRFSKDELSRFSHQIPSYMLTVRDAADELKGCRQLDPTATPSQLLHVIDG